MNNTLDLMKDISRTLKSTKAWKDKVYDYAGESYTIEINEDDVCRFVAQAKSFTPDGADLVYEVDVTDGVNQIVKKENGLSIKNGEVENFSYCVLRAFECHLNSATNEEGTIVSKYPTSTKTILIVTDSDKKLTQIMTEDEYNRKCVE